MASLFDLPVIYIIENNQYSMGTSLERSSAFRSCLAERAAGFAIDWDTANGEEIYEVRAKVQTAIERAHRQSRPTVLEISTYRHYGHSVSDAKHAGGYRSKDEIERYKDAHDPIRLFKARLISEGVITEEKYEEIDNAAREEAAAASQFAVDSPVADESSITEDIYFEVDRGTEAGRTGRHFFND
jgi:pyruvate dehydrogenase E1 component alpha subunit